MRREAGFTLVELMVVVGVIAILAAIVVPTFMRESREATADSEVTAMFAELGTKEQTYRLENQTYLSTGASEADTWPAAPTPKVQNVFPIPATWQLLKVQPPESTAKCGYVAVAGAAGDAPGPIAAGQFNFASPSQDFYYLLAHCDLDGDPAQDAYYFQSSLDSTIQKVNPGN